MPWWRRSIDERRRLARMHAIEFEMTAYYNEFDPKTAAWLRELIARGLIANGEVDERSIEDVQADDLRGFTQCHFFAGIGGWSYALRLAGWPDERPVWTGSPPCQFKSSAARGRNNARDMWPEFRSLIGECSPRVVFGEEVANCGEWFDGVCDDMESMGYSIGAAILPACSVGKDHKRERLFFVCDSDSYRESGCAVYAKTSRLPGARGFPGEKFGTDGVPSKLAIKGAGNAIVPQVAAEVIGAFMEIQDERR